MSSNVLYFDRNEVAAIFKESKKLRRPVLLVKDEGVYIMCQTPKGKPNLVCYADGFDTRKLDTNAVFERSSDLFGFDDFYETIPHSALDGFLDSTNWNALAVRLTGSKMQLFVTYLKRFESKATPRKGEAKTRKGAAKPNRRNNMAKKQTVNISVDSTGHASLNERQVEQLLGVMEYMIKIELTSHNRLNRYRTFCNKLQRMWQAADGDKLRLMVPKYVRRILDIGWDEHVSA